MAIAVVCLGQIIWWIYFQVTISEEQLEFHAQQSHASAELAAFFLNRNYERLSMEAESFVSVDNIRHLTAALDLLASDPAVKGYQLFDRSGLLVASQGEHDSTFYLPVMSVNSAVIYLDIAYPGKLTEELSKDLRYSGSEKVGRYQKPWFDSAMFAVREEVTESVEYKAGRRVLMFTMEGSFFVLLTLLGAYIIYRTLKQSEELKHRQENFIQAVTHELKIPVASIKLYLETMATGKFDQEKVKGFIPRMIDDCNRLEGLVDNVLEAGRFSRRGHQAKLVESNLSNDLVEYIEEMRPMIERYKMKLTTEIEPELMVKSDYHAMRRVVTALIDNAIKYSPENRREMTITARKISNRRCEIVFADQGVGVEKPEQSKVFERFYRTGEENTRSVKGTGIGLFLVKQIVTEHRGKVELKSEGPNKGSQFIIELPLASEA
ncbi:MAG: HAMP domain-containing histidine kinase [bacterium]|nr:HAMP domain-containing histidine kinase [bacterium]